MDKKIAIIGAGNLATRVSIELYNQGVDIVQVYSRTAASAVTLAKLIGCPYVIDPEQITTEADIYLISVSDMAMGELLGKVNFNNKLIAHTSGSISMDVLESFSSNYGVFYPLQTFSKYREVDFSVIPVCIEANRPENEQELINLASVLTKDIRLINSEQRRQIHLAAVFANNFTNHLYAIAEELLKDQNVPFDILRPIIEETAAKVRDMAPDNAQTGPAVRNDSNVMDIHLEMLKEHEQVAKIYELISENIYKHSMGRR